MVNKSIYNEMRDLGKKSASMRSLAIDGKISYEDSTEMRKKQTDVWNKFQFYKNFIKASDKLKGGK